MGEGEIKHHVDMQCSTIEAADGRLGLQVLIIGVPEDRLEVIAEKIRVLLNEIFARPQ